MKWLWILPLSCWLAGPFLGAWLVYSAEELPTPVDEHLAAIATPQVIVADEGFCYAPSGVTASAVWSAEYLSLASFQGDGKRPSGFHVDRAVHADLRASVVDYATSGYDIGHLAPDADTGDQQGKIRRSVLTNAVPQKPGLNRGLWRRIEDETRNLIDERHSAYVVTLPIYLYRTWTPSWIGAGHVMVPTHLAKAVLVIEDDRPQRMVAWLVENKNPIPSHNPDAARAKVDEIEKLSALDLFAWLDDEVERRLEAAR